MIGAVDIGGTKIAVGLIDGSGRVLARAESPTYVGLGYQAALGRIEHMLREVTGSHELHGIGIGCTGPVDPISGELGEVNFFPEWRGENPVEDLCRIFGVLAAMENDADAAALAEAEWGAGKMKHRLIYVTVGTGIGGGIILDGRLYRGTGGSHPEIGHHVIDPDGPPCSCGSRGCWEAFAAGPAMEAWLERHAQPGSPRSGPLSAKEICELAAQGDVHAQQAVHREGRYLGLGLANLHMMFAPDMIVLGGSVMKSAPLFLDEINKTIAQCCVLVPHDKTVVALASLGDDANLIGAARVWYHRFDRQGRVM